MANYKSQIRENIMLTIAIHAPFQTSFTIKTNCKELANAIVIRHGKYATKSTTQTDITIIAEKEQSGYSIYFNGNFVKTNAPLKKIEDIMYDNRKYEETIFAVHGGAVEYNNGAHLFIAATTSGKTTLTSYLSSNGFGYITDDCILIDRNNFNVYPFNTPIHLRKGGYEVLDNLGVAPKAYDFLDDISIKRYIYNPQNCITHSLPLKRIYFIERVKNYNLLEDMSTTGRITHLLKSPIVEYKLNSSYLSFISKLAKIPCSKLYYSDMKFVAEVIKNE